MNNAGSELVRACEDAWQSIKNLNPEVGDAIIVVGSGGRRAPRLLGHFIPEKWEVEGRKVHEVLLVAENLRRSGAEVFTTLLHESVHALAYRRDIRDVSGQRHNKRFLKLAQEMGMIAPEYQDKTLGFSAVTIDELNLYHYNNDIRRIEEALKICRSMELKPKAEQTSWVAICDCERRLRLSRKQIEEGPIVCGLCEETFSLIDE